MDKLSLINQLNSLRQLSYSQLGGSRHFVPPADLTHTLTGNKIHEIISGNPRVREDERNLFVSLIQENCLKIFAILLYNGHDGLVPDFLYRRCYDFRLPLSRDDLNFLPHDASTASTAFIERQWEFLPVDLKRGDLHQELSFNQILPFLEDTNIARGGFGEIFKVKLHANCQSLLEAPNQDVGKPKNAGLSPPLT